jgi:rhodanese-related sulfurtransferase
MKINFKSMLLLVGLSLITSVPCALAHTDVTPEEAHELIGTTDDLTVVDVREPSEYCNTGGHIPGALNYPLSSGVLHERYEELPMDGPILVVCQSGGRSNQAATFLDSQGFSMVYDMMGGMNSWIWETELCIEANEKYSGGTGEPNDPYQIATAEDLIALGETPEDYDKHFILTSDIDLDPNLPGGRVFDRAVIAPDTNDVEPDFQGTQFTGMFDGNRHTISHLTIIGTGYLGLFGQIAVERAIIRNLGVMDVNITGSGSFIGGLAGDNHDQGTITTCYSTGSVSGESDTGGLLGHSFRGFIDRSWSTARVTATSAVGGLLGGITQASINYCYSDGTVHGDSSVGSLVGSSDEGNINNSFSRGMVTGVTYVGGLVGHNQSWNNQARVTECYSIATVNGDSDVGGLIGCDDIGGIITSSFWDIQTSGQAASAGGIGNPTAEMQTAGTFIDTGWDFVGETENGTEDIWSICEGTNYPRFVWQIPAGDFVCPDGITIEDFSFLMEHWLDDNCDSSNGYCDGTDLDQSGTVDVNDLEIFFDNWPAEN